MFFCIYFSTILGFTFVFMTLLPEAESPFADNVKDFVKVVSMMIGEVEYGDTFAKKNLFINIFFLLFVFIINIMITNLLIGLTVSNVTNLIANAQVTSLEFKVRTITQMENTFVMKTLLKHFNSLRLKFPKFFNSFSLKFPKVQHVCIQPRNRVKSLLSEVDLTAVHKVTRGSDKKPTIGEKLQFMYLFYTYVPITVFEESIKRLKNLEKIQERIGD